MIVKAGLGLIGLGALSVGSVALAKPGLLGMMPRCTALSKDHDFDTNYGSSSDNSAKFGAVNKENLVGVVGTTKSTGNEKSSVEEWWEWSFERLKKAGIKSGKFKYVERASDNAVTTAYDKNGSNSKALNQVCKEAYKSEVSKITAEGTGDGMYKESEVWEYCSWLGKKPEQAVTPKPISS